MNEFEKYLKENKKKMELDHLNPDVWLSIENDMLKKKNRRNRIYIRWVSATAAALVLGLIALGQFYFHTKEDIHHRLLELYELEKYDFPRQIDLKTKRLNKAQVPLDRKEDFEILLQQLEFLDGQYNDYLQYIEHNGFQEFIGEQILNYYKSKVELLDKIQAEIEKIDHYENKYNRVSPKVDLLL